MLRFHVLLAATLLGAHALSVPANSAANANTVPGMFKKRWAGVKQEPQQPVPNNRNVVAADEVEDDNTACITRFNRETKTREAVCGEMSFDSDPDGMICIDDPKKPGTWICEDQ
jgi:hypothetical protein